MRHQMEETRAALTEKLETLEHQVVGTVKGATTAVSEAVENVKGVVEDTVGTVKSSVQETVETVKSTFDLRRQVERHPWGMVGGSFALGCLGGFLLGRSRQGRPRLTGPRPTSPSWSTGRGDGQTQAYRPAGETAARETARLSSSEPGWLSGLGDLFGSEIAKLKGLGVGMAMGVVRDLVTRSVPDEIKPRVTDIMNSLTAKLGGEPVQGPVLPERFQESCPPGGPHQQFTPSDLSRPVGSL
jgi:ElaB/YqjD/DUF883 family membrane-anchored ribosome-binding protein